MLPDHVPAGELPPLRNRSANFLGLVRFRSELDPSPPLAEAAPGNRAFATASTALPYRRIRGNPKCGKTPLSPNQVSADIPSPSSVSTSNAYGRAISVRGLGK